MSEHTIRVIGREERDLARLPAWARDYISGLEGQLAQWEREADAVADPNAVVQVNPLGDHPIGFEPRTIVRFQVPTSNGFREGMGRIDVKLRDGLLNINASSELVVLSGASNAINVGLVDSMVDEVNRRRRRIKEVHGLEGEPL